MKRILAAALALALLVSLAACGSKKLSEGTIKEGICYEASGISPDADAMTVDGTAVPMDMYFYNLCYAASYMDSFMGMYGMDFDWELEVDEGLTVLDAVKQSALENTVSFIVLEQLAKENNAVLSEEDIAEVESELASTIESLGGEESYRAELAKVGLREETYERMLRSDHLYSTLAALAGEEGSSLYPTEEKLLACAEEQGYMTADHILLLTKDMTTYQSLDEETIAEKKALAEEIKAKLDAYAGDDLTAYFKELGDEYSEDGGRAANPDGYTFGSGQMVEEFESTAAALAEGEVSDIVESYYGYHIILRKPLDTALAADAVSGTYFDDLVSERIESAVVEMSEAVSALDVPAVYESFAAAANAESGDAGDTTEDSQESAEN